MITIMKFHLQFVLCVRLLTLIKTKPQYPVVIDQSLRFLYDINEELVGYCKQAEYVRETCSRHPANYYLDNLLQTVSYSSK